MVSLHRGSERWRAALDRADQAPGFSLQLIFSVLKSLTGQPVTVELKNDLSVSGTLRSVDQ